MEGNTEKALWFEYISHLINRQREKLNQNRNSIYLVAILLFGAAIFATEMFEKASTHAEASFLFLYSLVDIINCSAGLFLFLVAFLIRNSRSQEMKLKQTLERLAKSFLELPLTILFSSLCCANLFNGALARDVGFERWHFFVFAVFWGYLIFRVHSFVLAKRTPVDLDGELPTGSSEDSDEVRERVYSFLLLLSSFLLLCGFYEIHELAVLTNISKSMVFVKLGILLTCAIFLLGFLVVLLSADFNLPQLKDFERTLVVSEKVSTEIKFAVLTMPLTDPLAAYLRNKLALMGNCMSEFFATVDKADEGLQRLGKGNGGKERDAFLTSMRDQIQALKEISATLSKRVGELAQIGFFNLQKGHLFLIDKEIGESMKSARAVLKEIAHKHSIPEDGFVPS